MAHDYVKDNLQIESQTGRISFQILATLLGGVLLICSVFAELLFDTRDSAGHLANRDNAGYLAMASAILLGAPLIWVAIKDCSTGTCT